MWLLVIPIVITGYAVVHDLKSREIPDSLSALILILGLLATNFSQSTITIWNAFAGMMIGFLLVLPFALRGGIGGGDLKLVSALGTWLGIAGTFSMLFWTSITGMVFSIAVLAMGKQDLPYAPAILCGLLMTLIFPDLLPAMIRFLQQ